MVEAGTGWQLSSSCGTTSHRARIDWMWKRFSLQLPQFPVSITLGVSGRREKNVRAALICAVISVLMLPPEPALLALLLGLIFFVAVAYSSVGHGGASGYLAVLSFFGLAPAAMAPSALCLNLLVAGTSFTAYWRAGLFVFRLLWPFLLTSIPFAFLGGLTAVPVRVYLLLLSVVLLFAAFRLLVVVPPRAEERFVRPPRLAIA